MTTAQDPGSEATAIVEPLPACRSPLPRLPARRRAAGSRRAVVTTTTAARRGVSDDRFGRGADGAVPRRRADDRGRAVPRVPEPGDGVLELVVDVLGRRRARAAEADGSSTPPATTCRRRCSPVTRCSAARAPTTATGRSPSPTRSTEDAVWDDGTPITSADVEFTWQAILNTTGTLTTVGYDRIASVDTTDPKVAVVEFTEPLAAWADLFGSCCGVLLKADAFESADIADELSRELPFSGGPFVLESFDGEGAVLARNEAYWDDDAPGAARPRERRRHGRPGHRDQLAPRRRGRRHLPAAGAGHRRHARRRRDRRLPLRRRHAVRGAVVHPGQPPRRRHRRSTTRPCARRAVRRRPPGDPRRGHPAELPGDRAPELRRVGADGRRVVRRERLRRRLVRPRRGWRRSSRTRLGNEATTASTPRTASGSRSRGRPSPATPGARRSRPSSSRSCRARHRGHAPTTATPTRCSRYRVPQLDTEIGLYAPGGEPRPVGHDADSPARTSRREANDFSGRTAAGGATRTRPSSCTWPTANPDPRPPASSRRPRSATPSVRTPCGLPFYQLPLITAWRTDLVAGPVGEFTESPLSGFWNLYDWTRPPDRSAVVPSARWWRTARRRRSSGDHVEVGTFVCEPDNPRWREPNCIGVGAPRRVPRDAGAHRAERVGAVRDEQQPRRALRPRAGVPALGRGRRRQPLHVRRRRRRGRRAPGGVATASRPTTVASAASAFLDSRRLCRRLRDDTSIRSPPRRPPSTSWPDAVHVADALGAPTAPARPLSARQSAAVEAAKELLVDRLARRLTLAEVGAAVGMSPFHLARSFRQATGTRCTTTGSSCAPGTSSISCGREPTTWRRSPRGRVRQPQPPDRHRAPALRRAAVDAAGRAAGGKARAGGVGTHPYAGRRARPLLRHDADLLRQRRAPHRPRLHDRHRRRPRPLAPPRSATTRSSSPAPTSTA